MSSTVAELDNVVRTYVALAETMPQVLITQTDDAIVSIAPFAHPLCNFAVVLTPAGLPIARRAGEGRPHFMTYVFDPEIQPNVIEFRLSQELTLMRVDEPGAGPPLQPIEGSRERMLLGRFMASQFFGGHRPDLRERIAEANARASGLEFFGFNGQNDHKLVGAATLHDIGGVVGIYNVCVAGPNRHRGLGSTIVERLLGEIGRRGKSAVLQCDASLVSWYRQFGFCESGILRVWSAREI